MSIILLVKYHVVLKKFEAFEVLSCCIFGVMILLGNRLQVVFKLGNENSSNIHYTNLRVPKIGFDHGWTTVLEFEKERMCLIAVIRS